MLDWNFFYANAEQKTTNINTVWIGVETLSSKHTSIAVILGFATVRWSMSGIDSEWFGNNNGV